jgi:ATP-dependent DNA ligase
MVGNGSTSRSSSTGRGLLSAGEDGSVTIRSRSARRLDTYFPDLRRAAHGALPGGTVLDGELIAWSAGGLTDFGALRRTP